MKVLIVVIMLLLMLSMNYLFSFNIADLPVSDHIAQRITIKFTASAGENLSIYNNRTSIESVDAILTQFQVRSIHNRFRFDKKKLRADLPNLSLIYELEFPARTNIQHIIDMLSADPNIEYAETIPIDSVLAAPNDPNYVLSTYLTTLEAEQAWEIHKGENGSQSVTVAIIDTGVNWKHADLVTNIRHNLAEDANSNGMTIIQSGNTWVFDPGDLNGIDDDGNGYIDDLIGWDFKVNSGDTEGNDPYQTIEHGNAVAGIANQRTNNALGSASLAWNVKTMPISCSYGTNTNIFKGYDAIIYAAENGADVVNCSWGSVAYSQANQDAITYAYGLGAIIIAAAGNNNNSIPIYPAGYINVVAVAAVNDNGSKTSSSNYGAYIDVAAPTQDVWSIYSSAYSNYTSYASPIASGLAALLKSYHPTWTNSELITQLRNTCDNINAANPGKENMFGKGRLNAYHALHDSVSFDPNELRIGMFKIDPPNDANGNLALERGEEFSLNIVLRNYTAGASANTVNYTISSGSSAIAVLSNQYAGSIYGDSPVSLNNVFRLKVSNTATTRFVNLTLTISSPDAPVLVGSTITFSVLINAGGIYVWEGTSNGRDMSGTFIKNTLTTLGYTSTLSTIFPFSFHGFSSVFLSFGNPGSNIVRLDKQYMFNAIKNYLEEGGRLYIEGAIAVGYDLGFYFPDVVDSLDGDELLFPLLGISTSELGGTNPISSLSGDYGWQTNGLEFTSSNQTQNLYINKFTVDDRGIAALYEDNYGVVGVQSIGSYGQRTFIFSYALRELVDNVSPNTRQELLNRIMTFFTASALTLPDIQNLSLNLNQGKLLIDWDYPFPVTAFKVFTDSVPDGDFSNLLDTTQDTFYELNDCLDPWKFYRIQASKY